MNTKDTYTHLLGAYAIKGERVLIICVFSESDCVCLKDASTGRSVSLLCQLVKDEIYRDGISFLYPRDIIDLDVNGVLIFE